MEASKIQGFKWSEKEYKFKDETGKLKSIVEMKLEEKVYLVLALRYKEMFSKNDGEGDNVEVSFEVDGYLTQIDTGRIDTDFMNSRFDKYLKMLTQDNIDPEQMQRDLDELHKSFATLTKEEQKYANIFLHDVQSGNAILESGKIFRDYITEYQLRATNDQIRNISKLLGLEEDKLRKLINANVSESNINEYGRFDELRNSVDKNKAKEYFEKLEGETIPPFKVNIRIQNLLQKFILTGEF